MDVRLEVVDSNGLVLLVRERTFAAAAHYRRFMQKRLAAALTDAPSDHPFRGARLSRLASVPAAIRRRWSSADARLVSQLCPDVMGQENPRVVGDAPDGARGDGSDHEPVVARRTQPAGSPEPGARERNPRPTPSVSHVVVSLEGAHAQA